MDQNNSIFIMFLKLLKLDMEQFEMPTKKSNNIYKQIKKNLEKSVKKLML